MFGKLFEKLKEILILGTIAAFCLAAGYVFVRDIPTATALLVTGRVTSAVSDGTHEVTTGTDKNRRTATVVYYHFEVGGRKYEGSSNLHNESFSKGQRVPDIRYLPSNPITNRYIGPFELLAETAGKGIFGLVFLFSGLGILWFVFFFRPRSEVGLNG